MCRIPVEEIAKIENEIELTRTESELELASAGEGAPLAVSQLIGTPVVGPGERRLGRARDVMVVRRRDSREHWRIHGLLVGRRALLQRAGFQPLIDHEMREGRIPENFIAWDRVARFDEQGRLALRREDLDLEPGSGQRVFLQTGRRRRFVWVGGNRRA